MADNNIYISKSSNYDDNALNEDMRRIRANLDFGNPSRSGYSDTVVPQLFEKFNRWNVNFPDYHLNKTFSKVFFTRPDLNILTSLDTLTDQANSDQLYLYTYKNNPKIIQYLTKYATPFHQFNTFLSNNSQSFEVSDEYIKTVEAGETFTGHQIIYGKNDLESKGSGEIGSKYTDDYNIDIFKMHKIWIDYISKVYRGEFSPKSIYKQRKVLDYAVSVYYFLLANDGETILFWTKYTGVFPTNTSSSIFSWDSESTVKKPELSIKYSYSFKNDLDPAHLAEFNTLSINSYSNTAPVYDENTLSSGTTWVQAPFVDTSKKANGNTVYKLKWYTNISSDY